MSQEIDQLRVEVRHNEQTIAALRERARLSLQEAEDRAAENERLLSRIASLEKPAPPSPKKK